MKINNIRRNELEALIFDGKVGADIIEAERLFKRVENAKNDGEEIGKDAEELKALLKCAFSRINEKMGDINNKWTNYQNRQVRLNNELFEYLSELDVILNVVNLRLSNLNIIS